MVELLEGVSRLSDPVSPVKSLQIERPEAGAKERVIGGDRGLSGQGAIQTS